MKKPFIFLIVLSLFSLVSASDQQLPQICGGDSELIISCLGDSELVFLGGLAPVSVGGLYVGISPELVPLVTKEEAKQPPSPFFSIFPFLGLGEYEVIFDVFLVLFLMLIIILVWKRRKDQKRWEREETERKKRREE